jgi:arylsulfatase A-like enzyme
MPQVATGLRTRPSRQSVRKRRVRLSTVRNAGAAFRPATLLLLAMWAGLATGFIELILFYLRWRFVDATALSALQLNQHALWMVPLAHALIFTTCGLVLTLCAWLIRARWAVVTGLYSLCFLSAFALLLTYRGLSSIAHVALAGGIALRIAGSVLFRASGVRRLITYSLPVLIGLLALFYAVGPSRERMSQRQLSTAPAGAPNVLFIVLDTVRAKSLSLYGYGRETSPFLSRLAQRGVRFDQARAAAAWTLPSHASMFTGRWAHELSARLDRPLDETYPTLAEFLRDHGYDTAGFVANTFFCSRWFGLSRGFLHYEDVAVNPAEVLRSANLGRALMRKFAPYHRDRPTAYFDRKDGSAINGELLDWLDNRPAGHPFFAFLNFYDAHDPYFSPRGSARHFGLTPSNVRESDVLRDGHRLSRNPIDSRMVELGRDCYDDCIADLDEQLGRLYDALDSRGLLDNTLIVLTADHGEEFGEHGGFGHGQRLYSEVIRVPLLMVAPGRVPAGRIVTQPVTLRNLPATIVDLVGLTKSSPFPGRSLANHWHSAPELSGEPDDLVLTEIVDDEGKPLSGSRPSRALAEQGKVYICVGDGREELYDVASDPEESHDLSHDPTYQPLLERFRDDLRRVDR